MCAPSDGSLAAVLLPTETDAPRCSGMVKAAFAPAGGFDELQEAVLGGIATSLYGIDLADVPVADDDTVAHATEEERLHAVHLMVVLEFVEHPLSTRMELPVEQYAHGLGVSLTLLRDARKLAKGHFAWMYLDLQRHSWYEEETIKESVRGRWEELIRSKLAYTGVVADQVIAEKWRSLRDCPAGSWGKAVADFYDRHGFPFPGERYGIYELGARRRLGARARGRRDHPEGELDVFAFIASSMADERGLVLLAITLGLFQNGSIHHVAGKKIKIARADTLTDDGAVDRWVEAIPARQRCHHRRDGHGAAVRAQGRAARRGARAASAWSRCDRAGRTPVDSTARKLLVSVPTLHDPNFFRSVVFMIEHTDEGALGVVLNQPTETRIDDGARGVGAVRGGAGRGLRGRPGAAARSGDRARLVRAARSRRRRRWQPLIGRIGTVDLGRTRRTPAPTSRRCGSSPVLGGAPARGRDRGRWLVVVDAPPDDLLTVDPSRLWRAVLRRQGGDLAVSANYPHAARVLRSTDPD